MDYKEIIKSREMRIAILKLLNFIPDKLMLKLQYWIKTGRTLNLREPQRYSEKLQWYKISYRNELMPLCADKYKVRTFVKMRGYDFVLNENYGIYDSFDELNFNLLPKSFVLKDTLGGGGNSIIFVNDKDLINKEEIRDKVNKWLINSVKKKDPGREWIYEGQKHRIIAEKILSGDSSGDLPDYKFFCFNGEVFCLYLMRNYTKHHELGELGFFSPSFKLLPVRRLDFNPIITQPEKPKNFDKMIEIAKALSNGFPHVRVDLYNVDGKIIFGEMTFFNASGYLQFDPDIFDFELGKQFNCQDIGLY